MAPPADVSSDKALEPVFRGLSPTFVQWALPGTFGRSIRVDSPPPSVDLGVIVQQGSLFACESRVSCTCGTFEVAPLRRNLTLSSSPSLSPSSLSASVRGALRFSAFFFISIEGRMLLALLFDLLLGLLLDLRLDLLLALLLDLL